MNKRKQGTVFENYAAEFLKSKGYVLLAQNYFSKYGEIDLIMKKEKRIIFVEVKQRTTDIYGSGEYAVDFGKKRKMYFTAQKFLVENGYFDCDIRFDAVIFRGREEIPCSWIRNIIWGDEIGF